MYFCKQIPLPINLPSDTGRGAITRSLHPVKILYCSCTVVCKLQLLTCYYIGMANSEYSIIICITFIHQVVTAILVYPQLSFVPLFTQKVQRSLCVFFFGSSPESVLFSAVTGYKQPSSPKRFLSNLSSLLPL